MRVYALYDPITGYYLDGVFGKPAANWQLAKHYKHLKSAVSYSSGAGLMNTSRNFPNGMQPNKHYQNLPNVEVHEYVNGSFVATHSAPPSYIFM